MPIKNNITVNLDDDGEEYDNEGRKLYGSFHLDQYEGWEDVINIGTRDIWGYSEGSPTISTIEQIDNIIKALQEAKTWLK